MTPEKLREILAEEWAAYFKLPMDADSIRFNNTPFKPALAAMSRISSIARDEALEAAAEVMKAQRIELERQMIEKAQRISPSGGVLYNPEQTIWKKAEALISALRTKPEERKE